MPIVADMGHFPNNAISLIGDRLQSLDSDMFVTKRPLRESDPNQAVGIYADMWIPNESSYEMRGNAPGQHTPTLSRYGMTIQAFVRDADELRGLATHNTLGNLVRRMLYHDAPLRLALNLLDVPENGGGERLMKWGVQNQRYFSNEIKGTWLYLSTLEFWIETESY